MTSLRQASSVRRWCFTLNNYTEAEFTSIKNYLSAKATYAVIGKEIGENQTPHLQAYVCLRRRQRFTAVKSSINSRIHLEAARSSPATNRAYCTKSGEYWEFGEMPRYGRSSDSKSSGRDEAGQAFIKVMEENTLISDFMKEYPAQWLWHGEKLLRNYTLAIQKPLSARPNLVAYWIYGPPGIGKSKIAHEIFPNAYIKDHVSKWWDDYRSEQEVILDDISANFCDFSHLLRWLDVYKCRVEVKGGFIPLAADRFIITSNSSPLAIWPPSLNYGALSRRIQVYPVNNRQECEMARDRILSELRATEPLPSTIITFTEADTINTRVSAFELGKMTRDMERLKNILSHTYNIPGADTTMQIDNTSTGG